MILSLVVPLKSLRLEAPAEGRRNAADAPRAALRRSRTQRSPDAFVLRETSGVSCKKAPPLARTWISRNAFVSRSASAPPSAPSCRRPRARSGGYREKPGMKLLFPMSAGEPCPVSHASIFMVPIAFSKLPQAAGNPAAAEISRTASDEAEFSAPFDSAGCKIGGIRPCMRPLLQPASSRLAMFLSVREITPLSSRARRSGRGRCAPPATR